MIHSRIAPTPSGYLHIGNALNFVITWLWVRREGGTLRLRIDDRSLAVVQPEYLEDIFSTLKWLGIDWDEGPGNADEQQNIYSEHLQGEKYAGLINKIIATGQVFACSCTRKAIQAQSSSSEEHCPCQAKKIPLDQPDTVWRVITPENCIIEVPDAQRGRIPVDLYHEMRDFIIRRRDGIAAYQVVSLSDDMEHKTNLVIRGMDLLPSSAAQIFLARLIGDTGFHKAEFYHHPLLTDSDGEKLSKSAGSNALKSWGPQTTNLEEFYGWVCKQLGWSEQVTSAQEMLVLAKAGRPLYLHAL